MSTSNEFDTEIATVHAQGSTPTLTAIVQDAQRQPIPGSSLTSLEGWLYDQATKSVINGFEGRDLLNANGGSVSQAGALSIDLSADDMVLMNESLDREIHVLQLKWTWNGGTKVGYGRIMFQVRNLEFVG